MSNFDGLQRPRKNFLSQTLKPRWDFACRNHACYSFTTTTTCSRARDAAGRVVWLLHCCCYSSDCHLYLLQRIEEKKNHLQNHHQKVFQMAVDVDDDDDVVVDDDDDVVVDDADVL